MVVGSGLVSWAGEVQTEAGEYQMELRTDARARLLIDDQVIIHACNAPPDTPPGGKVRLSAGWHRVRIDFDPTDGRRGVEWVWRRPDGVREIVPPSRLRYRPDGTTESPINWPALPSAITCGS
jgi:hypothetical protein